jgi:hypothetical protein
MLLSHFRRLCISLAPLIAASSHSTVISRSISLPSALQQSVPSCAQTCLQNSLADKFPVACSGQENIQCLCSHYSNGGESLGEVALGCVYTSCSRDDPGAASAYNVCLGQRDAVMPTKSVLTVVASKAPRTTSTPTSFKSTATPTTTTTLRTQVTSTASAIVDTIYSTPSATSSPSPSVAAVPVTTEERPKMTPAQIAGLSVAAVAAFVVAIGLMALSVCLRRRRERKNVFDSDEKGLGRKSKKISSRFSHYVTVGDRPEPPKRFPIALPPAARRKGDRSKQSATQAHKVPAAPYPNKPVQQNGVGTSNSSNSSLPLDQIGVAISAELDGKSATPRANTRPPRTSVDFRPISSMTQDTVFEEDEVMARRRSSVLLPTPPVPVAPIRRLQPSKRASALATATGFPSQSNHGGRPAARRSELFLDIPVLHERPQPRRIIPAQIPSTGSPQQLPSNRTNRLAPAVHVSSSTSPQRTPGSSTAEDIDDYYFSAHEQSAPRASPAYITRSKDSPKSVQVKSKRSGSTVSRATSRTSTNIRDSGSSQTSFETADISDPTPEDEDDDKQLSDDNKLSPVAESPISKLRYPKVPRASNQLVPRSPRSPKNVNSFSSPQNQPSFRRNQASPPSASHLLQNRQKNLAPLLLESRVPLKLNAPKDIVPVPRVPLKDPFTSPPRARTHMRSNSTESWSTTPHSKIDRKSRTQSGMWPSSPAMYDEIRPLNVRPKVPNVQQPLRVRRNQDEMSEINVGRDVNHDATMNGLKSPVWVPRLTPTRKGDDLFISVGWGGR